MLCEVRVLGKGGDVQEIGWSEVFRLMTGARNYKREGSLVWMQRPPERIGILFERLGQALLLEGAILTDLYPIAQECNWEVDGESGDIYLTRQGHKSVRVRGIFWEVGSRFGTMATPELTLKFVANEFGG